MKNIVLTLLTASLLVACTQRENPNQAAFVTLLGNDTLAVEQFVKTDTSITAQVVLRTPETSLSSYFLEWNDSGGIETMTKTNYPPVEGFTGTGAITQTINRTGDSLRVDVREDDQANSYMAPYEPGVLPFIDMVHWPFEVAFNRAVKSDQDTVNQPLLSGNRISNFVIAAIEDDSMTIRHPFRGVMGVRVNNNGGIEYLDAGLTTRKLKVHRVDELNMDAIGKHFAHNPVGELSGAISSEFSFKNTNFRVDYGSPQKRGRELFGGIVPWGERWRTGANRATHFYTSNDLSIGDLDIPAGEYTLFTIPEKDGGTLIINKQTGQNGQAYDVERDLGRVPMEISTQDEATEAFTIAVEETDSGGVLQLIWGETVFSVPFTIE